MLALYLIIAQLAAPQTPAGAGRPLEEHEAFAVVECRFSPYPEEVRCDVEEVSSKARWARPAARSLARSAERNHDLQWMLLRRWNADSTCAPIRFRSKILRGEAASFDMAALGDAAPSCAEFERSSTP